MSVTRLRYESARLQPESYAMSVLIFGALKGAPHTRLLRTLPPYPELEPAQRADARSAADRVKDMGMPTVHDPQPAATRPLMPWRVLLTHVRPHAWILIGGAILGLLGSAPGVAKPP